MTLMSGLSFEIWEVTEVNFLASLDFFGGKKFDKRPWVTWNPRVGYTRMIEPRAKGIKPYRLKGTGKIVF